jgi:hypothetical protein
MRLLLVALSTVSVVCGQFVPDNDDYQDDLSFLDVAIDRGENARLCNQLMRMTLLANLILLSLVLIIWGFCGTKVGRFYANQKPRTPDSSWRRIKEEQADS